jgi:hypothetical protein
MENETAELDALQAAHKAAVEEWIAAIRREETLASVNHTVAQLDQWNRPIPTKTTPATRCCRRKPNMRTRFVGNFSVFKALTAFAPLSATPFMPGVYFLLRHFPPPAFGRASPPPQLCGPMSASVGLRARLVGMLAARPNGRSPA